jgi:drug/metabolite transporter (DMT)-like permease
VHVASTVTYLLPVVAIILGIAVLGEHISLPVLAGIALILSGVALVRKRSSVGTADHYAPSA